MNWRLACMGLLALAACGPKNTPIGGPTPDGGTNPDTGFTIQVLDSDSMDLQPFSMAIDSNDRVSVAYYKNNGTYTDSDGSTGSTYGLQYLEWQAGNVSGSASIPTWVNGITQVLKPVRRVEGVSVAIQPNGQPAVAFMGGYDTTQQFWYQHEAYFATHGSSGWSSESLVQDGTQATPALNPAFNGFLVGVWPALVFDTAKAYYIYRNCHNGQFNVQDWQGSDSEVVSGSDGAGWSILRINEETYGFGGHNQMVMAAGQPAVVFDSMKKSVGDAESGGADVYFQVRQSDGTWSPNLASTATMTPIITVADTQAGPALAYDDTVGFGVAVVDHTIDQLKFLKLTKGQSIWTSPDTVWGSGSGGWYPSLAFNPSTHLPHIAFFICDTRHGINDRTQCRSQDQQLAIAYNGLDKVWHVQPVDYAGGWWPKLGFLSNGKRVVVYRAINGSNVGQLKMAVEK